MLRVYPKEVIDSIIEKAHSNSNMVKGIKQIPFWKMRVIISHVRCPASNIYCVNRLEQKKVIDDMARNNFIKVGRKNIILLCQNTKL